MPTSQPAAMVSVIAKNLKDRRQHQALCDVFDKADLTGDGTISIQDYLSLCSEYGVPITEEVVKTVESIADEKGEIHKNDFIVHVKQSHMIKAFESADRESEFHWNKKASLAFRLFDINGDGYVNKMEFKWMTSNKKINKKQIEITFKRCDLDGDGKLNYDEFRQMMFRQKVPPNTIKKSESIKEKTGKSKGKTK